MSIVQCTLPNSFQLDPNLAQKISDKLDGEAILENCVDRQIIDGKAILTWTEGFGKSGTDSYLQTILTVQPNGLFDYTTSSCQQNNKEICTNTSSGSEKINTRITGFSQLFQS